jgi:5-methylcytosine-specific restriction endonuclease McrA
MLREATGAKFLPSRRLLRRRYRFAAGRLECDCTMGLREHGDLLRTQAHRPVAVAVSGRRRYWWFHDRFWWEDDDLDADDVLALVVERERRAQRRLERAHAVLRAEVDGGAPERTAIPIEIKRAVWQRCAGRCAECGSHSLLEFDHIIPLALGGSNGERNLQLLCAECNRAKGDSL